MQYGTDHDAEARNMHTVKQKRQLKNFTCRQSGVLIDNKNPFLGASADGIGYCECCGNGVLEIKCPYTNINHTAQEAATKDSNFFLSLDLILKFSHMYYIDIQLQMYINNVNYCDVVVFTQPSEPSIRITQVFYNAAFCEQLYTTKCSK